MTHSHVTSSQPLVSSFLSRTLPGPPASPIPPSHNPRPCCTGLTLAAPALVLPRLPLPHPQMFPAPQPLCLSFLSFLSFWAWPRPPSPEVFPAVISQNYDRSQVLTGHGPLFISNTFPASMRMVRGGWAERPLPPALSCFAHHTKPSAQAWCAWAEVS